MEYPVRPQVGIPRPRRSTHTDVRRNGDAMRPVLGAVTYSGAHGRPRSVSAPPPLESASAPTPDPKRARRPSLLDTPPVSPGGHAPGAKTAALHDPTLAKTDERALALQSMARALDADSLYFNPQYIVAHVANLLRVEKLDDRTRSNILAGINAAVHGSVPVRIALSGTATGRRPTRVM